MPILRFNLKLITYEIISQLKVHLDYNCITGVFTWSKPTSNRVKINDVAGRLSNGYIGISVNGIRYQAHRLAWSFIHGEIPEGSYIDHIDRDRSNNSISNLRLATKSENNRNLTIKVSNKTGYRGVSYHKSADKYEASLTFNRRKVYLGLFDTPELANQVVVNKRQELYGDFSGN